jgi:hypothetical protein
MGAPIVFAFGDKVIVMVVRGDIQFEWNPIHLN